ncbi:hypothetical protein [Nostoc sp. FACHB-888]|uniref:hypothetical protein n=1 Tax=Nostoc sp. FACHB-888 TaxID=2692842 RepID=UPI0018EFDA6D|nr:hypothetical protein [Nostoc sp. FACHB-888]
MCIKKSQAIAYFNLFVRLHLPNNDHWLFQGNPKYYRIIDGNRKFEQMPCLQRATPKTWLLVMGY